MRKPVIFLAVAVVAATFAAPVRSQNKDIVDTAVAAGSFKVLVKLVQDAGLVAVLNDAKVVNPGIAASNGVIHVIDEVLLPPK